MNAYSPTCTLQLALPDTEETPHVSPARARGLQVGTRHAALPCMSPGCGRCEVCVAGMRWAAVVHGDCALLPAL